MTARFSRRLPLATVRYLLPVLAMLSALPAKADQCARHEISDRPRIALVLGGGGARGFAHVGVLKRLEEMRIPYHYITGTSMGSIVGGLAATGMNSDEISKVIRDADWDHLFSDESPRDELPSRRKDDDLLGLYGPKIGLGKRGQALPSGVVAGQNIMFMFEQATSNQAWTLDFDRLPIPYRAVATDLATGNMVVLDEGSMSGAMRASMAVPGVFDPVPHDEMLLADGGLARNLPVDVARDMGADIVIAVDVGTPLLTTGEMKSALAIVTQFTSLLVVRNTEIQIETLHPTDVLIRPQLGTEITSASFDRFEQALPLGYAAAVNVGDSLAALSVSEAEYQQWQDQIRNCTSTPSRVDFVRLENHSRYSDAVILDALTIKPGETLDTDQVEADLERIHSLGFVRLARYRMVQDEDLEGIEIQVFDDQRGANMLETGVTVTGDNRQTSFNLQAAYLKTDLDQRGSEFRGLLKVGDEHGVEADVYKYLDDQRSWYLNPEVYWGERHFKVFEEEDALAEVNLQEAGVSLRFGHEFNRQSNLSAGVRSFKGELGVVVGQPAPSEPFDGGEWDLQYVWDSLDDLFLPTRGTGAFTRYIRSSNALGADEEFDQVEFSLLSSKTWGLHSAQVVSRLNTSLDADIPDYALFTGGGFLNMSGFEPNQLFGRHFGMVGLGYRYQLGKSGLLPGYAGVTFEYGNAANDRDDVFGNGIFNGSVYFGYSTPLGPLYLGYGYAQDRSGLLFFSLGAVLGGSSVGRR